MFLILAAFLFKSEVAKWHVAMAIQCESVNDRIGVLRNLDRARVWDAEAKRYYDEYWENERNRLVQDAAANPLAYSARAASRQFRGDGNGALEDLKRAKELSTSFAEKVRESVPDAAEAERVSQAVLAVALNGLAYFRALNERELDEALEDIERALRLEGETSAYLDTRGFVHLKRKEFGAAKRDLDRAIELAEAEFETLQKASQTSGGTQASRTNRALQLEATRSNLAILLYHRTLVSHATGQADAARDDENRIRALGVEPRPELW